MTESPSIYKQILAAREKSPVFPYLFQNAQVAGRQDILEGLLAEGIPSWQKEDHAFELCQIIREMLEENSEDPDTEDPVFLHFLEKQPLYLFFLEFRDRLKRLLDSGILPKDGLYRLGIELVQTSTRKEAVKAGMLIIGLFPYDTSNQLLKTLGYHSEYTLYALYGVAHTAADLNEWTYDLAVHTTGYGRLAALFTLYPLHEEQQKWFLEEGVKSTFLSTPFVNICVQKADMQSYLRHAAVTKENYHHFMYLFSYADVEQDLVFRENWLTLQEKVLRQKDYVARFIDLAGLIRIWHDMIDAGRQDQQYLNENPEAYSISPAFWEGQFERLNQVINSIEEVTAHPKWEVITRQEMAMPAESDQLILMVLSYLRLTPAFVEFLPMLQRKALGLKLQAFFLEQHPDEYFEDVCHYLNKILNTRIYELPLEEEKVPLKEINNLFRADIWLQRLFITMIESRHFDEEWCLKGLIYHNAGVRELALKALIRHSPLHSGKVAETLKELLADEPNEKNRKLMLQLLYPEEKLYTKEIIYLPVSRPVKTAREEDVFLLESRIIGWQYKEIDLISERIDPGMILQVVQDTENSFDSAAIAITLDEGFVLGFLPKRDQRLLLNLLNRDESLYARLETTLLCPDPQIKIYLQVTQRKKHFDFFRNDKKIVSFPAHNEKNDHPME